jgi:hypothetical protein
MAATVKLEVKDQVRGTFDYELHVGESIMRDPKFLLHVVNQLAGNVFTEMNSDICTCGGVGYMQHIVGCPVLSLGGKENA